MKSTCLPQLILVLLAAQTFFGCSPKEYFRFSSHPEAYNKVQVKPAPEADAPAPGPGSLAKSEALFAAKDKEPVLEAHKGAAVPVLFEKAGAAASTAAIHPAVKPAEAAPEKALNEAAALQQVKERLSSMSRSERKSFKREIRAAMPEAAASASRIVLIILAILLPPLAVALHEGIGSRFWISLLLTLLFVVPGIIFALLVVTDSI